MTHSVVGYLWWHTRPVGLPSSSSLSSPDTEPSRSKRNERPHPNPPSPFLLLLQRSEHWLTGGVDKHYARVVQATVCLYMHGGLLYPRGPLVISPVSMPTKPQPETHVGPQSTVMLREPPQYTTHDALSWRLLAQCDGNARESSSSTKANMPQMRLCTDGQGRSVCVSRRLTKDGGITVDSECPNKLFSRQAGVCYLVCKADLNHN